MLIGNDFVAGRQYRIFAFQSGIGLGMLRLRSKAIAREAGDRFRPTTPGHVPRIVERAGKRHPKGLGWFSFLTPVCQSLQHHIFLA